MEIKIKDLFDLPEGLNSKMISVILSAIKEGHIDQFDYLKFKQSVLSMQKMGMDEETSIKSAFATASTMGLTKAGLLKTVDHYANIINKEKDEFAQTLKKQISVQIEKPRLEAENADTEIQKRRDQIAQLEKEIKILQQKKETVGETITTNTQKINMTRDAYAEVYQAFMSSITNDKTLIDQLIS